MRNLPLLGVLVVCILTACAPRQLSKAYNASTQYLTYAKSVGDAAKPQVWEIDRRLTLLTKENPNLVWQNINGGDYVLMSSWVTTADYYKNDPSTGFYNTSTYDIWVTAAPQVQDLCKDKRFGRKEGLDLRLKQLIGLPPTTTKNFFVEFWIKPEDLYRPCPDRDVTQADCTLSYPEDTPEDYKSWMNNLRLDSYYNPIWDKNYPWTQLGYTYDWNKKNKSHIGLSEFVITQQSEIVVHKIYSTEEYCVLND